jgi:hypothetical protein
MKDLADRLEALAEKATPENWRVSGASLDGFLPIMAPGGIIVAMLSKLDANHANDATLIVELRNALPEIIAAVRFAHACKLVIEVKPGGGAGGEGAEIAALRKDQKT